ncbi:MFS transporter [Pedosphaera parvula]|uniref:Major facilitator superfamily MFS_1 n=1 Tax=Pedosphaera parvula (strain Ellin514) TaxID=320771 RepID=B9XRZ2_PEDPL|nr:MFS transporter [Pedosphaera parvula]EEF57403.1 major facilitator superfamily MFS_1 [Pedosphaera parvula Ellin514]
MSSRPPHPVLIALLAITAGITVANIYYCQPILGAIAGTFHVNYGAAARVATCTQLGYALGLLLLVPLGDIFERRRLIVTFTAASALVLVAVGNVPGLPLLVPLSLLLGTISITPQLVVPYSAGLVPAENRGRVVGIVMSGLLIGILLSRTLSGFLNTLVGWRAVYFISAGIVFALAILLVCVLPKQCPEEQRNLHYGQLLASLLHLIRTEPILRRHALIGAFSFAGFSAFWTTLAFHLESLPGKYGSSTVGMFGLFGAAGALAAPLAGRLADRYEARLVNGAALLLIILSFAVMGFAGTSLVTLAIGVILMDAGVQGSHISNQTRIYALHPALRNRLNSVYMFTYFLGGSLGSAIGSWAWTHFRWPGVCAVSALSATLGLITLFTLHPAKPLPKTKASL